MGKFKKAYPSAGEASPRTKVIMVAVDCILIALAPILVQLSKDSQGGFAYSPVTVNILVELVKTTCAFGVLLTVGTGRSGPPMTVSARSFAQDAMHCRLLFVPATLYAVNNYLKFIMQLFFKPTSAKMLGNLKVLTIALLMKVILKRNFSIIQWEALFLLVAGISINQLSNCENGQPTGMSVAAVCTTLGTVSVPSLASVFNEYGFKKDMDTSIHVQNFFLYFFGLVINCLALFVWTVCSGGAMLNIFRGLNMWTLALVLTNASQGILASFFYKFADTILKKYSSTLATIFTGIMSAILFAHAITVNFCVGISIVFISMHQFFTDGDKMSAAAAHRVKLQASPSMEHFVDNSNMDTGNSVSAGMATVTDRVPLLPR